MTSYRRTVRYYDLVLVTIPILIIGGVLAALVTGLPEPITLIPAGAITATVVGHALFIKPPPAIQNAASAAVSADDDRSDQSSESRSAGVGA